MSVVERIMHSDLSFVRRSENTKKKLNDFYVKKDIEKLRFRMHNHGHIGTI